jgi:thymidylate synthase (FAD)
MSDDFYTPHAEDVCLQSMENKQGRDGSAESSIAQKFVDDSSRIHGDAYASYLSAIEGGVARETARCILPVSAYTEWYWKCDLHNIFHFLKLRMDSHAQKEIRVYAEAMYATIRPLFPLACSAFEDYRLNAMELTAAEVEAITSGHAPRLKNKREIQEWSEKAKKLGL